MCLCQKAIYIYIKEIYDRIGLTCTPQKVLHPMKASSFKIFTIVNVNVNVNDPTLTLDY